MENSFDIACDYMQELSKTPAKLMQKYKAHGATDVTGFGILGHAENLVNCQKEVVNFRIHTLPIITKMNNVQDKVINYKLLQGYCP